MKTIQPNHFFENGISETFILETLKTAQDFI